MWLWSAHSWASVGVDLGEKYPKSLRVADGGLLGGSGSKSESRRFCSLFLWATDLGAEMIAVQDRLREAGGATSCISTTPSIPSGLAGKEVKSTDESV